MWQTYMYASIKYITNDEKGTMVQSFRSVRCVRIFLEMIKNMSAKIIH